MVKRTGMLLWLILLLWIFPAAAQDEAVPSNTWTISLYEQTTGRVTQISSSGAVVAEVALPMPEGFDTYNYDVAIAESGSYIAYIVSDVGDGSNPVQPSQLVVYDTATQSMTAAYDLNAAVIRGGINAASSSLAFDRTGTRVVTGYYVPVADVDNQWMMEFVALDVATGEVVNTLTGDRLAGAGVSASAPYRARVIAFDGDHATLLLYPIFQQMSPENVVFNWNVATGEVTDVPAALRNATDHLPLTGEVLLLTYDVSIDTPAEGENQIEGMMIPPNTVQLYNLATGDNGTIFAQDISLISAKFVQNGERILLFADAGARGILIERDGTVLAEFPNLPGDILTSGVTGGFIYVDPQQGQAITSVTTFDGDFTPQVLYTPQHPFNLLTVQDAPLPDMGG